MEKKKAPKLEWLTARKSQKQRFHGYQVSYAESTTAGSVFRMVGKDSISRFIKHSLSGRRKIF